MVVSDGAAGLIGAVERTMGAALRQRCLIHRARNVLAKIPTNAQAEVKADYWAIFDLPDTIDPASTPSHTSRPRLDSFAARWRDSYPAAVRCLLADRDGLTVYLRALDPGTALQLHRADLRRDPPPGQGHRPPAQ